jgi:prepilin-type N-terminal cleavage/methylation domain-containing protein
MKYFKRKNNQLGFSMIEVLIAAAITSIIATSAFRFYTKMHEQSEHQYNVSEMHQLVRTSLYDIRKTLMQAGFKVPGHAPYEIKGDSLAVYYSETQPVDTILYFLEEYTDVEYAALPDLPGTHRLYKLYKKVNSDAATVFADYVVGIDYNQVDAANIIVSMGVHALRKDDSYQPNDGYRTYRLSERINIRNVS